MEHLLPLLVGILNNKAADKPERLLSDSKTSVRRAYVACTMTPEEMKFITV